MMNSTRHQTVDFDAVLKKIREAAFKCRPYASFWEWPDKQVKERGVVKDLLESIEFEEGIVHSRHLVSNPDKQAPVDCFGIDTNGKTIAYEVTELVSEEAIQLNCRGEKVYKVWNDADDLLERLRERLTAKNDQLAKVDYDKQVVVIFTGELFLRHEWCVPILSKYSFGPFSNMDEAFLLFSYVPGREKYPYIRLKLA